MKIYIITIHCIHNFGSVFQSYALAEYLRKSGYDVSIIDYRPNYYRKGRNKLRKYASIALNLFAHRLQHKKYLKFINDNVPVTTKVFYDIEDLKSLQAEDAVFIAGGDQIWNNFHPCGRDDAYKLCFVEEKKKIAFGTSMGRNTFTEDELNEIKEKIKDYKSIGLREQSTVLMLQPFTDVPTYHAADPVMLLNPEDYRQFIGKTPIIKEPYLLMYLADKSNLLNRTIEYLADKRKLKVVHVCGFSKKCKCDYFLKSTGPSELLNLIYFSNFVVSASFHATLFSIIFNKQFCTLLPEAGTNRRIEDLLSFFDLGNRIVDSEEKIKNLDDDICFDLPDKIRKDFVKRSQTRLLNELAQ